VTAAPLIRSIVAAKDLGSFNRARIDLQRFGTPSEVLEVLRLLPSHPMDGAAWFERLRDNCFWEKPDPEPYERVVAEPEWTFYRGVGDPGAGELVIGLAGAAGNVNHSSPIILQRLDARRHDLLILRDLKQEFYANGVAGTGSFAELLERVAETAAPYGSCLTIGSSMGGGPALEAGVALGARRAISLGGGPREGLTGVRSSIGRTTELWCVYGADNSHDSGKASRLREVYPSARLLAVPGVTNHNVTAAAFHTGTMTPLFELLLSDAETAARTLGTTPPDGRTLLDLVPTCEPPPWTRPRPPRRFGRAFISRIGARVARAVRPSRRS
jgi:hypothetical protein